MIRSLWTVIAAGSLLLALPTAGRASWVYYGGSPQHTGVATEPLPAPLSVVWKYCTGYAKGNTASPVVDGDTIYFVSKDYFINQPDREGGRVYAIRADTGELKWKSPSGDQPSSIIYYTTPVVSGGNVYVGGSDGGMYCLDAATGSQKWKFPTGAMVRSHPLVEENTLYFGSNDGFFYAIDATTADLR
jgi:outer membrane protein assembly factor BamB